MTVLTYVSNKNIYTCLNYTTWLKIWPIMTMETLYAKYRFHPPIKSEGHFTPALNYENHFKTYNKFSMPSYSCKKIRGLFYFCDVVNYRFTPALISEYRNNHVIRSKCRYNEWYVSWAILLPLNIPWADSLLQCFSINIAVLLVWYVPGGPVTPVMIFEYCFNLAKHTKCGFIAAIISEGYSCIDSHFSILRDLPNSNTPFLSSEN